MDHLPFVMTRARDSHIDISGHALMASCPTPSTFDALSEQELASKMPDISVQAMPDLLKLLDLSSRLPLDGEITPVMAWAMILGDERCAELTAEDVRVIKEGLLGKIRCYGFGAVLEEFEVRDALMTVLAGKSNFNGNTC